MSLRRPRTTPLHERLDALDRALWAAATPGEVSERLALVPFDHARQLVSALVRTADGTCVVVTKGAPEVVLDRCTAVPAGVAAALAAEFAAGNRVVAVATSGGPIAMAAALLVAGRAVDAPALATLWAALNRVSVNTGVTKVIAGRRGLSMSTYNEHTHLETDARLLTYR